VIEEPVFGAAFFELGRLALLRAVVLLPVPLVSLPVELPVVPKFEEPVVFGLALPEPEEEDEDDEEEEDEEGDCWGVVVVVVFVGVVLCVVVTVTVGVVVVVGWQLAVTLWTGGVPAGSIWEGGVPGGAFTVNVITWPFRSVAVTVHWSAEAEGIAAIAIVASDNPTVRTAIFSLRLIDTLV
jgi:hypothetical protein